VHANCITRPLPLTDQPITKSFLSVVNSQQRTRRVTQEMDHAAMTCVFFAPIAVAAAVVGLLVALLHILMPSQDKRREADESARHSWHAQDRTSSTLEKSQHGSRHERPTQAEAWRRVNLDQPGDFESRASIPTGPADSTLGRAVSEPGEYHPHWLIDPHKSDIRTRASHGVPSLEHRASLSGASGLCACGRCTCARKTHDGMLVKAKQQITRRQQPRRAKMQSAVVLPAMSEWDAYWDFDLSWEDACDARKELRNSDARECLGSSIRAQ
jgi:hypothetical protein